MSGGNDFGYYFDYKNGHQNKVGGVLRAIHRADKAATAELH
jgi:hypothetical protein